MRYIHSSEMSSIGQLETSALEEHSLAPRRAGGGIQLAEQCQRFEWLLIAAAAPFLILSGLTAVIGVLLVAITWCVRRAVTGRWSVSTAAHPFMLVLLGALFLSLLPSVSLAYSASKFWGLLFGIALFYAVINTCRSIIAFQRAALVFIFAGLGLAGVGMLGMAASGDKGLILSRIYSALPHVILPVQSSTTTIEGFNPNEVGGMLTLFIPAVGLLALHSERFGRLTRLSALACTPVLSLALLLTQSRTALGAVILALLAGGPVLLGATKRQSAAFIGLAVLLAGVVFASATLAGRVDLTRIGTDDAALSGTASLPGRTEMWQRAGLMLIDMPFTGIGLNSFPLILHDFYPTSTDVPESLTPHAHNLLLQTALDLGVFGLAAFLGLLVVAIASGMTAIRGADPLKRTLAAGLLLGLSAHIVFNMVDAVTLGSKPGPALWAVLGLLVALGKPNGARLRWWPLLRHRWRIAAPAAVGLVALAVAPVSLNVALVGLHRGDLWPSLDLASTTAWGPYPARVLAARAIVAKREGDSAAEASTLARAVAAAPWDQSLALELGQVRLAQGDTHGAVDALRPNHLDGPLMTRASLAATPESELEWLSLARQVDPNDWRAYAQAAWILVDIVQPQQPQAAAPLLASGLRLRGSGPTLNVVAERLDHPRSAELPNNLVAPTSQTDLQLLAYSSAALTILEDYDGALFVTELLARAEPSSASNWFQMSYVLRQLGRDADADTVYARGLALQP